MTAGEPNCHICFFFQSFDGPASDSDVCSYHSGFPIFHEGFVSVTKLIKAENPLQCKELH